MNSVTVHRSFLQWLMDVYFVRRRAYTFSGFRFLRTIAADPAEVKTVIKATQVGVSELMIVAILEAAGPRGGRTGGEAHSGYTEYPTTAPIVTRPSFRGKR